MIHGGLQAWWIAPVLARLSETPLFATATILTAFNDNALITYLSTLVPNLSDSMKTAVMEGAVTGGGLTVIANAPNPAGQAILSRYFGGAVLPIWLLVGALLPTLMAVIAFRILERRDRLDRHRERRHRDGAAGAGLSRRRRRAEPAWVGWLPFVNAFFNSVSACAIVLGFAAIRRGRRDVHQRWMFTALAASGVFLVLYVIYHALHGDSRFLGQGVVRPIYFAILISHILLSVVALPLVLSTFYLSLSGRFAAHRRVARWTFPIRLYVSVTGVVVFLRLPTFGSRVRGRPSARRTGSARVAGPWSQMKTCHLHPSPARCRIHDSINANSPGTKRSSRANSLGAAPLMSIRLCRPLGNTRIVKSRLPAAGARLSSP